jgi:hypothetical protein
MNVAFSQQSKIFHILFSHPSLKAYHMKSRACALLTPAAVLFMTSAWAQKKPQHQ